MPASFVFVLGFTILNTCFVKFAFDRNWTVDLWCQKQSLLSTEIQGLLNMFTYFFEDHLLQSLAKYFGKVCPIFLPLKYEFVFDISFSQNSAQSLFNFIHDSAQLFSLDPLAQKSFKILKFFRRSRENIFFHPSKFVFTFSKNHRMAVRWWYNFKPKLRYFALLNKENKTMLNHVLFREESLAYQITSPFKNKLCCFLTNKMKTFYF